MEETVTILRTAQILFSHVPSKSHTICKIDIKKLNWKLQKLQSEGMLILGVYFDIVPAQGTKGALTGRVAQKVIDDKPDILNENKGE